jgi:hypothetical protein
MSRDLDSPPLECAGLSADSATHLVTDEELQLLLERDHEERALDRVNVRRLLTVSALGGVALAAIALVVAIYAIAATDRTERTAAVPAAPVAAAEPAADRAAPTLADAKGIAFEKFEAVDATLPAIPAGNVKTFRSTSSST